MVKKLQKISAKNKVSVDSPFAGALPAGLLDGQLAQSVRDSAQQIWQAGLGAFAKAQGEGGKVYEALVKEGTKLQKKTQSAAEEKLSELASKVSGVTGEVSAKAGQQWDKLEAIFEERVERALKRLGVPTSKELDLLIKRIDALSAAVGGKAITKPANKPAAKKVVKKVAAQAAVVKTVAKKAAAKPAMKAATKPALKAAVKLAAKKPATKKAARPAAAA